MAAAEPDKMKDIYRIGIVGAYGGFNLGYEAILQGIIYQLRQYVPMEITVFSMDPEDTLQRHRVDRAVNVRKLTRPEVLPEIKRLDLLILGGGGILFDAEAKIYLREVMLAQEYNIPVMAYAVGAGPLDDPSVQRVVRECLNKAAVVTVRERSTAKILEEIGITKKIIITADPALLLPIEPLPGGTIEHEYLDGAPNLIGMSVREPSASISELKGEDYYALLANVADYMVDRFEADILFFPMQRKVPDVQHAHAVASKMLRAQKTMILKGEYTSGQLLSLIGQLKFAVSMRLHFLIFAALQNVPFAALPYLPKITGFLEDLKMEIPPVHLINAGRLLAYIDHAWDRKQYLQEQIRSALPELKKRALQTNDIAVRLLKGTYIEEE